MADSDNESGGYHNGDHSLREQERFLPIANVSRIMKKALPANAKISKEAKETVQECVSEFISFITGEGSDKCQREKRKTINGDDLLWAMTTLGFEDYVEPLKVYLQRFRDVEGEKTTLAGRHGGERETAAGIGGNGSVVNIMNNEGGFHENNGGGMVGPHHQGGHVFGSAGYYQMGRNPSGKMGSVYPGPSPINGRPRLQ